MSAATFLQTTHKNYHNSYDASFGWQIKGAGALAAN
jgi:hypothetical protein